MKKVAFATFFCLLVLGSHQIQQFGEKEFRMMNSRIQLSGMRSGKVRDIFTLGYDFLISSILSVINPEEETINIFFFI